MEKGLYKNDNGVLMYAQIKISYPNNITVIVADHENTEGEIYDRWYWFNTRQEALTYFGIIEQETQYNLGI